MLRRVVFVAVVVLSCSCAGRSRREEACEEKWVTRRVGTMYDDVTYLSVDRFLRVWFQFFVDVRDNGAKEGLIKKDLSSEWWFFTCACLLYTSPSPRD